MVDLNDSTAIKNLDTHRVADSISSFPSQIKQAWAEVSRVSVPEEYRSVKNIVVAGMGGSTLGIDVLQNLFKESLSLPLVINNHYQLPGFVDSESLVLLLSYSGTTEEVIAAANSAKEKQAKILGICVGGQLGDFLKQSSYPAYIFQPLANPSNQPRLGLGYTLTGSLAFLNKLGFLAVSSADIEGSISFLTNLTSNLLPAVSVSNNLAKQTAIALSEKEILIVGSEFLAGNAHVFANQTNENSKNFAVYFVLPELNHHLLEGLTKPESLRNSLIFVLLESELYSVKIKKRFTVTKEVLNRQAIPNLSLKLTGSSKLNQAFEGIVLSSWITFYLGTSYNIDASAIPWVDYFKKKLAEGS